MPGLLDAARTGVDAGSEHVALFEIARVYLPSGEQLPDERWRVAGVVQGGYEVVEGRPRDALRGARRSSFASSAARTTCSIQGSRPSTDAGWLGELHPLLLEGTWGAFELDLETLFAAVPDRIVYEDVLTYPATLQDIAVVVDEDVEVGALVDAAHEAAGDAPARCARLRRLSRRAGGSGRKSVAIHLSFQSPDRTLTEEEATEVRERIVAALAERFDAELRA